MSYSVHYFCTERLYFVRHFEKIISYLFFNNRTIINVMTSCKYFQTNEKDDINMKISFITIYRFDQSFSAH